MDGDWTPSLRKALEKRGKLPLEQRAMQLVEDAETSAVLNLCGCRKEWLVRHKGIDPKTKRPYKTYEVRISNLDTAILKCNCTLAVEFGKICSHVRAIQLRQERDAALAASGPLASEAQEPQKRTI